MALQRGSPIDERLRGQDFHAHRRRARVRDVCSEVCVAFLRPARRLVTQRRPRHGTLAVVLSLLAFVLVGPALAAVNPGGNNGTIKIDGIPFDDHPNNEPHPGCIFQVDFYGFDEGALYADVLFEAIPPTGAGEDLLTDTVFIGEDDNSGGGSERGLDASQTYDLTAALQGFTPHPKQGYHVKLTIHADGSQGADTKYKVFWVGPCDVGPPPVIPETPLAIFLPLIALATFAGAGFLAWRRRETAATTNEREAVD